MEATTAITNHNFIQFNGSNETKPNISFARNEELAVIEITVQSVIFVLAVLGNSGVLVSLLRRRRKSLTRMHLLMIHLSCADLFVAFGSVLPQLAWDITFTFLGGDVLCRLVKYMQVVAIYASSYVLLMTAIDRYFAICLLVVAIYASSYVLLMTAIDRYFAICFPLVSHRWSSSMVHKMVFVAWCLSLLFSLPQTLIFSYKLNSYGMYDCWGTFDPEWTMTLYITTFTILVYIIPTLILIFCYGSICVVVWKSGRIGEKMPASNTSNSHLIKLRYKSKSIDLQNGNGRTLSRGSCPNVQHVINSSTQFGSMDNLVTNSNCLIEMRRCNDREENKCAENNDSTESITMHLTTFSANNNAAAKDKAVVLQTTSGSKLSNKAHLLNTNFSAKDLRVRFPFRKRHHHNGAIGHSTVDRSESGMERRESPGISRAKIRTIKLTMAVVVCYLACWSPFFIAQMWAIYDDTAPFYGAPYTIILLLASLNSCTNPWIYLSFSDSVGCYYISKCIRGAYGKRK